MGRRKLTKQEALKDLIKATAHNDNKVPSRRRYEELSRSIYLVCSARTIHTLYGSWTAAIQELEDHISRLTADVEEEKTERP